MRATTDQVGRAHHHLNPVQVTGLRGLDRRRELGQLNAVAGRGRDVLDRGVIVTGQHRAKPAGLGHRRGLMVIAKPRAQIHQVRHMHLEIGGGHVLFAHDILGQLVQIAELTLTGGVVHQADDADAVLGAELFQLGDQGLGTHLGAQVQIVADPQGPFVAQRPELGRQLSRIGAVVAFARGDRPHPHRVKHGGDPRSGQFGVMGDDRAGMGPVDLGAGLHVTFKVIGVQLNQTGQDHITAAINRARSDVRARVDVGDDPVHNPQRSGDHLIRQNQTRVAKNCFTHVMLLVGHGPFMAGLSYDCCTPALGRCP